MAKLSCGSFSHRMRGDYERCSTITVSGQLIHLLITVDFGEVKTALTEWKEKCFQMSHLSIFTIVKPPNVDDSSEKEVR